MAWLRIDDGFIAHPKIVALTDSELRVWIRLLSYCARAGDPTVDNATRREVPGLSRKRCGRFAALALLDEMHPGTYLVHDWLVYQPRDATNHDRQARWRAKNGSTNTVTPSVTSAVTEDVTGSVTETVTSRAGTRAYPSRPEDLNPSFLPSEARPAGRKEGTIAKELPPLDTVLKEIPT
jgi:hypothetical protein